MVQRSFRPSSVPAHFDGARAGYAVEADPLGFTFTPKGPRRASAARMTAGRSGPLPARLRVAFASLTRGEGVPFSATTASPHPAADGHLETPRGPCTEHLRNGDGGLEQSWSFPRAIPGRGDLRLRLRVTGLTYGGVTDTGVHFVDEASGLGVRYGHATWVDASGKATSVPVRHRAGHLELVVPDDVVKNAAYPAVLDPVVSPEFGVDVPIPTPTRSTDRQPRVASNGVDYLVAWMDDRLDFEFDVRAARVDADGVVLDPTGLAVAVGPGEPGSVSVASNGADYLVAWDVAGSGGDLDIAAAVVTSAGTVVSPGGTIVTSATGDQRRPSATSDGSRYFVAWEDFRSGGSSDIYGARLDATGTPLEPGGIAVSAGGAPERAPAAASNGATYLVAFVEEAVAGNPDVRAARVASDGAVLDATSFGISTGPAAEYGAAAASDGTDFFVAFTDARNAATGFDVYGTRVSSLGVVLDPSGVAVSSVAGMQAGPHVAWGGSDYVVAWTDARSDPDYDVYAARVSPSAVVREPGGIPVAVADHGEGYPTVASNGSTFFFVYEDGRFDFSGKDIFGKRIAVDGSILDASGFVVATTANPESAPCVASNGTDYLVAWEDRRAASDWDIYGSRVTAAGAVLDVTGLAIATGPGEQRGCTAASNGTDFLVTFTDEVPFPADRDVRATRVAADGSVLDPGGIGVATSAAPQYAPAVASDGDGYLIAWYESAAAANPLVYAARVSASGALLDANGFALAPGATAQVSPELASDGVGYLAIWEQPGGATGVDLHGVRISSAGAVLDAPSLAISTAAGGQQRASVASDGIGYLVVWEDARGGASDLFGTRVSSSAGVLDAQGFAIASSPDYEYWPTLAASASGYLAVYQRGFGTGRAMVATRILGTSVESPSGDVLFTQPAGFGAASVGSMGAGSFLVAYSRIVDEPPYGEVRVRTRLLAYGTPAGFACADSSECESGLCVASVCCASNCYPDAGVDDAGLADVGVSVDAGANGDASLAFDAEAPSDAGPDPDASQLTDATPSDSGASSVGDDASTTSDATMAPDLSVADLGLDAASDASGSDADLADVGSGPPSSSGEGCACSAAARSSPASERTAFTAVAFLVAAVLARRGRAGRPPAT